MPGGSGAAHSSRSRAVSVTSSAGTPKDIRKRIMSAARTRSGSSAARILATSAGLTDGSLSWS